MLVATWNVNSVKARLERLLSWLERRRPDVVCLQELKTTNEDFPFEALGTIGYRAAVHGQKTWHGVAILSREEPQEVVRGLRDGGDDAQSRFVAATVGGVRVVSVYVPNGQSVGSQKYAFKRQWLGRFREGIRREAAGGRLIVAGDFNIAPAEKDVAHPHRWEGSVLYNPEMREEFGAFLALGLVDAPRRHLPPGTYSWWDYRLLSFPKNDGLRIDHILATADLACNCSEAFVDREERKGKVPSDHAPVVARFAIG